MDLDRCPLCRPSGPLAHPQVHLMAGFCVDAGVADLVQALHDAGVVTLFSCQEAEPGVAQVGSRSSTDLEAALVVIAASQPQVRQLLGDGDWTVRAWLAMWWRLGETGPCTGADASGPVFYALYLPCEAAHGASSLEG